MNPRIRRLQAEYDKLREMAERSPIVQIMEVEGNPPYKYLLRLLCKGISSLDDNGQPAYSYDHRLGIHLSPDFPRTGPEFEMFSPVWHPNIAMSGSVCYGDEGDHGYAPSMGLDDLVLRIIEIIRYENMGLNSAFNSIAAHWANQNQHLFPLDNSQIVHGKIEIDILDQINLVTSGDEKPDDDLLDDIVIIN